MDAGKSSSHLGRRTALKGAAVTAATIWTTPVVQVLSTESASAASSPPPRVDNPGDNHPPPVVDHPPKDDHPISSENPPPSSSSGPPSAPGGPSVSPPAAAAPGSSANGAVSSAEGVTSAVSSVTELAHTGANSLGLVTGLGAGAVALGGAAVVASKLMKHRVDPEDVIEPDDV